MTLKNLNNDWRCIRTAPHSLHSLTAALRFTFAFDPPVTVRFKRERSEGRTEALFFASSLCFFFSSSYLWPSSNLVWRKESYQSVPNQRLFQVAFVYARGAVERCVWMPLQGQCTETRRRPREHIWEKLSGFFIGMQKSPLLSFTVIRARWGEECIKIWNAK